MELTRTQLKEDKEFLSNLRLKCQALDHEWSTRSKSRGEELQAVSETLAILTEDDARDLLAKTVSFLQESSSVGRRGQLSEAAAMQARRNRAATVLKNAARNIQPDPFS